MRRKKALDEISLIFYALRTLRGWTLEEMAEALGISVSALSDYENGKRPAPERLLRRAGEAVGIPSDRVLDLQGLLREMRELMGGAPPAVRRGIRETLAEGLYAQLELLAGRTVEVVLGQGGNGEPPGGCRELPSPDELWAELAGEGRKERLALVEEGAEYQTWELCELLCRKSRGAAPELAELALQVAERVPGDAARRACVQAFAWAHLGRARREHGDPEGAEEALSRFRQLWQEGKPCRALGLGEDRLADLESLAAGRPGGPD